MADTPADDLTLHTPGDDAPAPVAAPVADVTADDKDAVIAQLQSENTSLQALVQALQDQLDAKADVADAPAVREARLIGMNWSNMTATEAKAAGAKSTVLCSDGYFVPGA